MTPEQTSIVKRRYLQFPAELPSLSGVRRILHLARGVLAFPFWWFAAALSGAPAMRLRWRCLMIGLRLMGSKDKATAYRCVVSPFDSVRHFEFDFFWSVARRSNAQRILDVSSPRLLPLLMVDRSPSMCVDIVNPDRLDLDRTRLLADFLGLSKRCRFMPVRVDDLRSSTDRFQLITSMSVLEHVEDDIEAVTILWSLLEPGGTLLVTVPCSQEYVEEFSTYDEYQLLKMGDDGFVFWQRYYDLPRLQRIFRVVGRPTRSVIYGENRSGLYDEDVVEKRTNPAYPHWQDSFRTARNYSIKGDFPSLAGMGVVGMEFTKPAASTEARGV